MKRYIVEQGSESGHCCFEWSVMDTHTKAWENKESGQFAHNCVCECYDKEEAENIYNLLNKAIDTVDHP